MRADLHVHSYYSGQSGSLRWYRSRDCYSSPDAVYRRAKARGMDVVTLTDHNSIDGCLDLLARHPDLPDFLVGEEAECFYPGTDLRVHVGVFGLNERIHRELQALRPNVFEASAFLRGEGLFFVLNHPFHFYTGQVPLSRYLAEMLPLFPGVEIRNGTMAAESNELVDRLVSAWVATRSAAMALVGGSDAHTLGHVGTTYTEATVRTREQFLVALHQGKTAVGGRHGDAGRVAYDIYGVILNYWAGLVGLGRHDCLPNERARGVVMSVMSVPFMFVPMAVSLAQKSGESKRVRRWKEEVSRLVLTVQDAP
jgi:predicted metal-dependent phosphoesterase TrpH